MEKIGAKLWKLDISKKAKDVIKVIDRRLALTEEKYLMKKQYIQNEDGYSHLEPYEFSIKIWDYNECYQKFWSMWEMYKRI